MIAGHTNAHPGVWRSVLEQRYRSQTNPTEFLNVRGPRDGISFRAASRNLLVVARKSRVESPSEPESAKRKHPLRIREVAQDLPDTPFIIRIAVKRLLFSNRGTENKRVVELLG